MVQVPDPLPQFIGNSLHQTWLKIQSKNKQTVKDFDEDKVQKIKCVESNEGNRVVKLITQLFYTFILSKTHVCHPT